MTENYESIKSTARKGSKDKEATKYTAIIKNNYLL